MSAAVGPAGQVPDDPGVDVAEEQLAGFGARAGPLDVVQDPLDLGAREVGRQRQTHLGAEAVLTAVLSQGVADLVGAGVLPDDGVVDRLAGGLLPDDGGLPLVGHADGGDVRGACPGLLQAALDHVLRAGPDLHRIVLDPAGLGVNLFMLFLVDGDDLAAVVEDHEPGTGGTLIDCC